MPSAAEFLKPVAQSREADEEPFSDGFHCRGTTMHGVAMVTMPHLNRLPRHEMDGIGVAAPRPMKKGRITVYPEARAASQPARNVAAQKHRGNTRLAQSCPMPK